MTDQCCASQSQALAQLAQHGDQRRVLITVLVINAVMFVVEFGAGLMAGSTALMADATDNLGDAAVYAVSLYAISRSDRWKAGAATLKGAVILGLGISIVINVVLKVGSGVPPSSFLMLVFGGLALVANLVCLSLLWKLRRQDVNMASSFECSRNDIISNCGALLAAGAVALTASPWPDILIGTAMAVLVLRSAYRVLGQAVPQFRATAL